MKPRDYRRTTINVAIKRYMRLRHNKSKISQFCYHRQVQPGLALRLLQILPWFDFESPGEEAFERDQELEM